MASALSNGDKLFYASCEGMKCSVIVNTLTIKDKTFYRLENGEYAMETNLGIVRAMLTHEVMQAFGVLPNPGAAAHGQKPL
jgi:hypothetical protein